MILIDWTWLDVVEEDLKALGVQKWSEFVQDRERWIDVVMETKTLLEL